MYSLKWLLITTIEVAAGVDTGGATKPHRIGRQSFRREQGKDFGNYDELSWQLVRTIVAVGANYRSSWCELSWQSVRTIVAVATKRK